MKTKHRIERLENKIPVTVIQGFLERMRTAKDDACRIEIGWELLQFKPSLVPKMDVPTIIAYLDAFPAEYSIAIRRRLSELLSEQTENQGECYASSKAC